MKAVFAVALLMAFAASAFAGTATSCAPVWTLPTNAGTPLTVSGDVPLAFAPNCNGTWDHSEVFYGYPDSPIANWIGPWNGSVGNFDMGLATSLVFDTTALINTTYDFGLCVWIGGVCYSTKINEPAGTDGDEVLTVANVAPTSTPTATPTSTSTATATATATPTSTPTPTCAPTLISPVNGSTISGTVMVRVSEAGCATNNRLEVSGANYSQHFDFSGPGHSLNTAFLPAEVLGMYVSVWWDSQYLGREATTSPITVTVVHATPTPTVTATPSPSPTSTPTVTPTATLTPTPTPTATASPSAVFKANDFLNSIGVNVDMPQGRDTVAQVVSALQYTGIRNFRNEATHADTGMYPNFCAVNAQTGAHPDMIAIVDDAETPNPACIVSVSNPYCGSMADEIYAMEQLAACGLDQVEGPNEPNNEPFTYVPGVVCNSTTFAGCAQYMKDLYTQVHADSKLAGIPVADLTEGGAEPDNVGLQFLPGLADIANVHNYYDKNPQADGMVWAAETPDNFACNGSVCYDSMYGEYIGFTWRGNFAASPIGTELLWETTETGASTAPGIDESIDLQSKTLTSVFLDGFARGAERTFTYKLFDETGDNTQYGMYLADHATPKQSGTYVHNLTTILADTSSNFTPSCIVPTISGMPTYGHSLTMQKSDGSCWEVIWDEAFFDTSSSNITVNFDKPYPVSTYDITTGTTGTPLGTVSSVPLAIMDHAVIVEY